MAIKIKYIAVGELEKYIRSDEYLNQSFYPISVSRAQSHAKNPRSSKEDLALILAYDESILVGYLGAIPEHIHTRKEIIKVCWYSCMWVLPEYRRSGIAKLLLEDAQRHYKNRVLISNYIPQSKAAFLKGGQFSEITVLEGVRAYLKLDLEHIFLRKKPGLRWMKLVLRIIDASSNFLLHQYFKLFRKKEKEFTIEAIHEFGKAEEEFIEVSMKGSVYKRGVAEFNWLRQFPWVHTEMPENTDLSKYYFSQFNSGFRQWVLKITNSDNQICGIVILTKHKRELKTPYILVKSDVLEELFDFIFRLMLKEKIRTLVTHHADFTKVVKQRRRFFVTQGASEYGFMATKEIAEILKKNPGRLYEGDGDGMFT